MKKFFPILSILLLSATLTYSQSLIGKFVENTYILSETKKSPDGFYFGNVVYNIQKGAILMINAVGDADSFRPVFIIRGPVEDGIEAVPTLNFIDTSLKKETNAVYIINKTGSYNIITANGSIGEKGTVKTSMGLGSVDWIANTKIFPTPNNSTFSLALATLLRHAIFKFNLIRGEKAKWGVDDKTTLEIPGALMNDEDTKIGLFYEDLDKDPKAEYDVPHQGCTYAMNIFEDDSPGATDKDTTNAIAKYESWKTMLSASIPTDFVVEREANYPLYNNIEDIHDRPLKNGRIITFSNNGNDAINDPSNDFYYLLASKRMKVELRLQSKYNTPKIYIRVYSEEK
jgi:hypothetical protein